jgi:hypothetical protein
MLNKQVCKQCLIHRYNGLTTVKKPWPENYIALQVALFDVHWDKYRKVMCVCIGSDIYIHVNPPKDCPYVLEHTLNEVESYEDMIRAY